MCACTVTWNSPKSVNPYSRKQLYKSIGQERLIKSFLSSCEGKTHSQRWTESCSIVVAEHSQLFQELDFLAIDLPVTFSVRGNSVLHVPVSLFHLVAFGGVVFVVHPHLLWYLRIKNSIAAVLNSKDHYSTCLENQNDTCFSLPLLSPSVHFQTVWCISLNGKKKSFVNWCCLGKCYRCSQLCIVPAIRINL